MLVRVNTKSALMLWCGSVRTLPLHGLVGEATIPVPIQDFEERLSDWFHRNDGSDPKIDGMGVHMMPEEAQKNLGDIDLDTYYSVLFDPNDNPDVRVTDSPHMTSYVYVPRADCLSYVLEN